MANDGEFAISVRLRSVLAHWRACVLLRAAEWCRRAPRPTYSPRPRWRRRLSRRLGVDHPARGGVPNLGSVHKGIKGATDGLDDLGAGPLVLALKCQTDRTQPRDEADQLRLGQGALDVDRLDVDVGPATRVEDGSDPLRV